MYNPKNILFIKLGGKGDYEKESIEIKKSIKLGYNKIDHQLCMNGDWDGVFEDISEKYNTVKHATTSHRNQIRKFYEEPETTMWITFYDGKLWYCYAEKKITRNNDGTKERKTIDGWKSADVNGKILFTQGLSGRLTKVQGFRGTICDVREKEYLRNKINGRQSEEQVAIEESLTVLRKNIIQIIHKLNWKDFEILVDLIFRSAGWSRIGIAGKEVKTIDLELIAPVTNERAIVQIKSQSSLALFNEYKEKFLSMDEYDKYFFVVHSPSDDLRKYIDSNEEKEVIIYEYTKLSDFCINGGLIGWLLELSD